MNKVASHMMGKYASLAAPIPSNGDAVSMAAVMVKKRPSPSRYKIKTISPLKENTGCWPAMGRNIRTVTAAHRETMGPSLKRKVVLVL